MKKTNKFISILSDYGFKVTFGDERDTLFLRKALEALIESKVPIKEVKFLRNEFEGITEDSRGGLYDLICEDENGNSFIVEMQLGYYKNYIHRSKFYAFQRFNTLVEKGKYKFEGLQKIYCIGFLANNIYPKSELYYHFGTLKNQVGENIDDQITHIIVEISKFDKKENEIQSNLDKLIFVMKNLENLQNSNQLPHFLSEDWIDQAIKKLDRSKMTPEQRMHFEMSLAKQASIMEMLKEEKRKMRDEALKETEQEVAQIKKEAEGAVEQIKKEAEGAVEQAKKDAEGAVEQIKKEAEGAVEQAKKDAAERTNKATAKKMKIKGMDFSIISEITTLSIEEIEKM